MIYSSQPPSSPASGLSPSSPTLSLPPDSHKYTMLPSSPRLCHMEITMNVQTNKSNQSILTAMETRQYKPEKHWTKQRPWNSSPTAQTRVIPKLHTPVIPSYQLNCPRQQKSDSFKPEHGSFDKQRKRAHQSN